jgi:phosphocarrier protein HPr
MELECAVEIGNKYGLHARASTRLAQVAKRFRSAVKISKLGGDEEVDAKSILGILTLGIARGQTLCVRVSGDDAEDALKAIVELVRQNFGED